jgi:hypothetical protein
MHTATLDKDEQVELIESLGSLQRLSYQHAVGFVEEVRFEGLVIDYNFS